MSKPPATPMSAAPRVGWRSRRPVIFAERALWLAAIVCASYSLVMYGRAHSLLHTPVSAAEVSAMPAPGSLIGRLDIPDIRLSVPVLEDDEAASLTRGVGHIRSTAMPGGLGTVGLAGHRDTFLRPLSRIKPKMEIRLANTSGIYRYVVDSTEIVYPEAVNVLDIVDRPELVIVTCYPFNYVGAAPQRFIVHAHLVSLIPG